MALAETPMPAPTEFLFSSFETAAPEVAAVELLPEQFANFLVIRALYESSTERFVLAKLQVADPRIGLPVGALCMLSGDFDERGAFHLRKICGQREQGAQQARAEQAKQPDEGVEDSAAGGGVLHAMFLSKQGRIDGVVLRPHLFLRGHLVVDETHPNLKFTVEPVAVSVSDLFRGAALMFLQRIQPSVTMGNPMRLLRVDAKSRLLLPQVLRSGYVARAVAAVQGGGPAPGGEAIQEQQIPRLTYAIPRARVPDFRLSTFGLRCAAELLSDDVASVFVEVVSLVATELELDATLPFTREIVWFQGGAQAPPPGGQPGQQDNAPGGPGGGQQGGGQPGQQDNGQGGGQAGAPGAPGAQAAGQGNALSAEQRAFRVGLESKDGLAFSRSTSAFDPVFETYRLGHLSNAHDRLHAYSHLNFNVMLTQEQNEENPFTYKPALFHDAAPKVVSEPVLSNLVDLFLSLYETRRVDRETVVINRDEVRRRLVFRRRGAIASLRKLVHDEVKQALNSLVQVNFVPAAELGQQ